MAALLLAQQKELADKARVENTPETQSEVEARQLKETVDGTKAAEEVNEAVPKSSMDESLASIKLLVLKKLKVL